MVLDDLIQDYSEDTLVKEIGYDSIVNHLKELFSFLEEHNKESLEHIADFCPVKSEKVLHSVNLPGERILEDLTLKVAGDLLQDALEGTFNFTRTLVERQFYKLSPLPLVNIETLVEDINKEFNTKNLSLYGKRKTLYKLMEFYPEDFKVSKNTMDIITSLPPIFYGTFFNFWFKTKNTVPDNHLLVIEQDRSIVEASLVVYDYDPVSNNLQIKFDYEIVKPEKIKLFKF